MGFDNRTPMNRLGLEHGQQLIDRARRRGDLHLMCQVNDVKLGYCYIRKNACSSFKKLFLDMGETPYDPVRWPRKIDYMISKQMMRSRDVPDCDRIVFVYRDPVARTVSLFKNKFIMRDGHEDLFRSYQDLAGEFPEKTTFRNFVRNYLRPDFRALDPHVLPQYWHLKRFHYSDAIPIENLHARMVDVIGSELAEKYFKRPVNATHQHRSTIIPGVADMSARDLTDAYVHDGTMPADESFLEEDLITRIKHLYADDFRMIESIE